MQDNDQPQFNAEQLAFNYNEAQDTFFEKFKGLSLIDQLKEIVAIRKDHANQTRRTIIDHGERLFPVKTENDFESVETDYGAPAIGLNLFSDLFHPTRSFRYEPMHTAMGDDHTHFHQAVSIGRSLSKKGFKIFTGLKQSEYPVQMYFANGGVTRAFSDVIDLVISEHNMLQPIKEKYGHGHRGAFLVPVPTYGLFLWRLRDAAEKHDIDIIPVRRRENGMVEPKSLLHALDECRVKNIHALAYYDCNPQNPTGHIREEEETEDIARILMEESKFYYDKQEEGVMRAVEDREAQTNGLRDIFWASSFDKPFGGIVMIDDMAYEDLEHTRDKKPYSFGQVSFEAALKTVVLKGVSKIGLPGARIGLMLADSEITSTLRGKQLMTEFAAHSFGVDVLEARYGSAKHRKAFNAHYNALRREHIYKVGVFEAMFNGLDNTDKLTMGQKRKLVADYADNASITKPEARNKLSQGLGPFRLADDMDCGFFHRIHCDALRDRHIYMQFDNQEYPSGCNIQKSWQLYWVFRSFGMHIVSASQAGCKDDDLTVRATFSLPNDQLFRFYDNMHDMRSHFFGDKPEVQYDLYRRNHLVPKLD